MIKWGDAKSAKYGTLTVLRERRCGRPGTALKVCSACQFRTVQYSSYIHEDGALQNNIFYYLMINIKMTLSISYCLIGCLRVQVKTCRYCRKEDLSVTINNDLVADIPVVYALHILHILASLHGLDLVKKFIPLFIFTG